MTDLANKHFLITGGTSGLGRATVLALAERGAWVSFVGRDAERGDALCREAPRSRFIALDLHDRDAAERVMAFALAAPPGRLDGAANVACGTPAMRALTELDDDGLERDLFDELRGFTRLLRAQLRHFVEHGTPASVVNVSSVNGLGASPRGAAYSALKAAVIALSKSAALDCAQRGVRVNALVPGAFDTPMLRAGMRMMAGDDAALLPAIERRYEELVPLGRLGRPPEAAAAIVWLLSDASSYVTGSSLILDGGLTSFAR